MLVSPDEAAQRVEVFSAALRSRGFRLTHQRLEVVKEIASTDSHPDAHAVYERVRERVPTISLDTVYRTLGTLVDLGLVRRVVGISDVAHYDANTGSHHHFICSRCGRIEDVVSADMDALGIRLPDGVPGEVESVEVRLHGQCRDCAGREAR